jgi:hypothetical protein
MLPSGLGSHIQTSRRSLPLADGERVRVAALRVMEMAREAPPVLFHERPAHTPIPNPFPIEGEGSL